MTIALRNSTIDTHPSRDKTSIDIPKQDAQSKLPDSKPNFQTCKTETAYIMATAQIPQTYDINHFNISSYLHDVSKSFQAKNGPDFVEKVFGSMVYPSLHVTRKAETNNRAQISRGESIRTTLS